MGKKERVSLRINNGHDDASTIMTLDEEGFFGRLFSPETVYTDVSGDDSGSDGTGTIGSRTFCTEASSSDSETDMSSCDEHSTSSNLIRFDRELRAKHRSACKTMTTGKYSKAIKSFESILSALLDRYGEEHHRVGSALHNVAVANLRSGLLEDARDAIEEAVRIRKLTLGEDDPKVADSLVEYGIILLSMKNYDQSIEVFEDALELRQIESDEAECSASRRGAQLKKAKIRHNIGCVNFEVRRYDEARRNYVGAIQEQKAIFETWSSAFSLAGPNTAEPGHLTMASTMCNKGYIDLEQERYKEAIDTFHESLKIQKILLEADNKLILSTMTNIGYCYVKINDIEKSRVVYKELVKLQSESYTEQSQRGWYQSIKKLIYCQVVLYEFDDAFDNLRLLEEFLSSKKGKTKNIAYDLRRSHQLMGEVNYQIFKFPTLSDYTSRLSCTTSCGCTDDRDNVNVTNWYPKKPVNGSKMSGHRMTYA